MIISPYQSTACKDYDLSKIIQEVMVERIDGKLLEEHFPIEMVGPDSPNPPIFTQPLTQLEFGDRKDAPQIVIDARALLRKNQSGDTKWSVANYNDMELILARSRLQLLWQDTSFAKLDLMRAGDLPAISFINWISKTITGRLGLDPGNQMIITALTGYYYTCLFHEAQMFDQETKYKVAQSISRWTRITPTDVIDIIEPLPYLSNIDEFIAAIKTIVVSSRISQLNRGLVYVLLGSSWFGANRQELIAVALEHPPTYLALVYSSLQLRGYRNAMLAKVVLMATKGGNDKDFIKNLSFLAKSMSGSH